MDDAQLIRRYVAEGSEAAFSELVGRHLALVHSAAMRQVGGDFHRAKDVSQKVFTLLARKAPSLARHPALTAWLYAATHFEASTLLRGERRREIREQETYHMNELLANPEPPLDWDQLRPVLDGAMFELNERDRQTLFWRYFDALPLAALGRKLGVSEEAAKKRVERALDKMRASFARRGATSTTAALATMLANHAVMAAPAGLADTVTAAALTAAAAGSPASGLLKFLGKAKLAAGVSGAMWVGGILAVPAIGAAAYELWTAWHDTAALRQENQGYELQQERLRALQRAAHQARRAAARPTKAKPAARDPKADFQNFLTAYPQARAIAIAGEKGLIGQVYGAFFRSAGLTPSQIGQFENLMEENWFHQLKIVRGELALDETPAPPADQMRALLGDQAYQQFQDYSQTQTAHYWASVVAANAVAAAFSTDQLDQLAQILAANTTAPQTNYNLESLTGFDWDAVLVRARTLFSDSQWKSVEPALLTLQLKGALAKAERSP